MIIFNGCDNYPNHIGLSGSIHIKINNRWYLFFDENEATRFSYYWDLIIL